jgi:hypothetical protein
MNSELTDLLIFLAIVCGPILAVGVAFNLRGPLGRALAARIHGAPERDDLAAFEQRLDARLAALERAVEAIAVEVERVGSQQRLLLSRPAGALLPAPGSPPSRGHSTPH